MSLFTQFFHLGIPHSLLFLLFITNTLLAIILLYKKKSITWFFYLLLFDYLFILIDTTVVFRQHTVPNFETYPFWSYVEGFKGKTYLLAQILLNIALFIPFGFLLTGANHDIKFTKVLLLGCFVSALIEVLQQIYQKGVAEFDDILHNTLGCLIGYFVMRIFLKKYKYRIK